MFCGPWRLHTLCDQRVGRAPGDKRLTDFAMPSFTQAVRSFHVVGQRTDRASQARLAAARLPCRRDPWAVRRTAWAVRRDATAATGRGSATVARRPTAGDDGTG